MANRSRTEIVRQIMETVNDFDVGDGITQTKLMHEVYLSSSKVKEYLVLLAAHRFLIHNPAMPRFSITEKGLRFLEIYHKLSDMISEEEVIAKRRRRQI